MKNLIEKENELISRIAHFETAQPSIHSNDYQALDKERKDDFKTITACTDAYFNYDKARKTHKRQTQMAMIMYRGAANNDLYYDHMSEWEHLRTDAHDKAITATDNLNKLYKKYGMEPLLNMTWTQMHDPRNRHIITSIATTYTEEASSPIPNHERQVQQEHQATFDKETQDQHKDAIDYVEQLKASIVKTPGKEYLYDPEYAIAIGDKIDNPEWLHGKINQAIKRGISRRFDLDIPIPDDAIHPDAYKDLEL